MGLSIRVSDRIVTRHAFEIGLVSKSGYCADTAPQYIRVIL